jgi:hypothetical protein
VIEIQLILAILALIDITASSSILFGIRSISFYVGYAMLAKGGWTVLNSGTNDIMFTLIGILDCVTGLLLLLSLYNSIAFIIGIFTGLKGIFSLISSLA